MAHHATADARRMLGRRRVGGLLAVVCIAAGVAVFGTAGASASSSRASSDSTLTWGMTTAPATLFTPTDYSTEASWVMVLIQGQMLTYGPQDQLEPAILSSWKEASPTKYIYTVRKGVKFSDGNPVTAADIAYTFDLQLDPKVGAREAGLFTSVKSAKASGPSHVIVTLKHPDSLVKYLPASIAGFVYEKASVEKDVANYGTPDELPVGAGPYMVSSYTPSQVTLVRNPHYYGHPGRWQTIVFKQIPNPETMALALRSGEIDGTFDASVKQDQGVAHIQSYPADAWFGLTMDMSEKPFSDINVRKALYYATDAKGIVAAGSSEFSQVASTVDDPSTFSAYLPKSKVASLYKKIQTFPFNLKKAKAALAASSVPNGFSTTLNVPTDSPNDEIDAQILKSDWAKIGVKLNIRLMPGGPRFQIILNHKPNLGVQIIGNAPDAPDPHEMAWEYFSSVQAAVNGNNSSNFRNPKVDKLLNAAETTKNSTSAALDIIHAEILASKSVPIISFDWGDGVIAVKNGWSFSNLTAFSPTTNWLPDLHTS
jgi:peptide/nickel transport system substrate-binding protein